MLGEAIVVSSACRAAELPVLSSRPESGVDRRGVQRI
jgi:hypothetical protein